MLKWLRWVILVVLTVPAMAFGAMVNSLYEVDVPVATQSQADWQAAVKEAYEQVLIKISANPNVMQLPYAQKNRAMAGSMVQSYRYNQNDAELNGAKKLMLHVQFDSTAVDQILRKADQPLLGRDRPVTLIWVVLQNDVGQSTWLTDGGNNTLFDYFQSSAGRKGLPLVWPVMDDANANQLSANDVIKTNVAAIEKASQLYQADSVLTGYVHPLSSQQWQGSWVLLKDGQTIRWQNQGDSTQQVIGQCLDELNNRSVVKIDKNDMVTGIQTKIQLSVNGINGLDDFAAATKYLQTIRNVAAVNPGELNGDKVMYNVTIVGDANIFFQSLGRQNKLVADSTNADSQNYSMFYFRWNGQSTASTQRNLQPALVSAPSLTTPDPNAATKEPEVKEEVRF